MVDLLEYNLPDLQLLQQDVDCYMLWIPDKPYIVLGASNNIGNSIKHHAVKNSKIDVLKRRTGGQTVMLTPNNIIISAIVAETPGIKTKDVFYKFNDIIIEAIEKDHSLPFGTRGISDIAIGNKKIMGSSMYRNKGKLFYHAVLNYNESPETFQKYLSHPTKEPDYRVGRSHSEFVTSLVETGYKHSIEHLKMQLDVFLNKVYINFNEIECVV